MELNIKPIAIPEKPTFNYAELKQEIKDKMLVYSRIIYSENEVKNAKADKANLNKLKKALNDERIRQEKEYLKPFNEFKAEINEIISIIDEPINLIDRQIKTFEDIKKSEKKESIKNLWNNYTPPFAIEFEKIFNEKWLNATVSMAAITTEIEARLTQIETDLATLQKLPEFSFEAIEIYKDTLNINKAIAEGQRLADIAKRKAEAKTETAKIKAEAASIIDALPMKLPNKQWLAFRACLSVDDALALKEFFTSRGIEYEEI